MKQKHALKAAEEFAKSIYEKIDEFKITEIILYGSLSSNSKNPKDIDIMIFHNNPILDKFLPLSKNKSLKDKDKFSILSHLLKPEINLEKILENKEILQAINENLLDINYLNTKFFSHKKYRNWWTNINNISHDQTRRKNQLEGETYLDSLMRQGKIYDPKTQKFDLSLDGKYSILQ